MRTGAVGVAYQSRPLDLFGPRALQLRAFFPLNPDESLLQKKDLEVLVHFHPLALLPLQVVKLHVYLRREREKRHAVAFIPTRTRLYIVKTFLVPSPGLILDAGKNEYLF